MTAYSLVVLREPVKYVAVTRPAPSLVSLERHVSSVVIQTPGPQGPPGSGGGSGARFEQSFTTTSVVVVNHFLGYDPHVSVIVGGESIDTDIVYGSVNQVTVTFASPRSGKVVCS